MRVSNLYACPDRGGGITRTVARFSLQDDTVKINGFRLRQRPDGSFITDAPSAHGERVVHLAPDLIRRVNAEATAAYRGLDAIACR